MRYVCSYDSPIGAYTAASDGESITGLWVEGQKYYPAALGNASRTADLPVFAELQEWFSLYFEGQNPPFMPSLAPAGSAFRQAVWSILCSIPYGETITYGEIARTIAQQAGKTSMSAQAVGGAVGHNPISILIPCHRVVGADGSLTGYAGGIDIKIKLLTLEGVNMDKFYVPRKGTAL